MEKKEKWTFEGESFEESLLIFGRMLADEVRRSGLRAYLPRGYILVLYIDQLLVLMVVYYRPILEYPNDSPPQAENFWMYYRVLHGFV